jgi:hypothetical protein
MKRTKQTWHRWRERVCFRYLPTFVNGLIHLSTYQARGLLRLSPLKVLVDVNVFAHGVTHETQWVSTGYSDVWQTELGYLARVPVHAPDCATDLYRNVQLLPGIAHLARLGFIAMKTSTELRAEEYRLAPARLQGGSYYDYNVFQGIRPQSLDTLPFGGYTFEELSSKNHQRARLDASTDPLYQSLLTHLEQKRSQDAWHLRTAEAHDCFCFLTMDFDLINRFEEVKHLEPFTSLRTKLMTPEALGKYLRLHPIPPRVLSYNGASFPVRPDLNQPGSRRYDWPKKRPSA